MSTPAGRRVRRSAVVVSSMATALVVLGCTNAETRRATHEGISVVDPAVGAVPGESAAVYLSLDNDGADDALVAARCDCSSKVSLHVTEDHGGVHLMVAAEHIDLPSGETTVLEPGQSHLMLEGLDAPLTAGSSITVTLEFEHGGEQTLEVPVVPLSELAERVDR